jgi:ribonuclease Z
LQFNIIFHPHKYIDNDLIFEDEKVEVRTIVLNHRIPCCGFVFSEKPTLANVSKEILQTYQIPVEQILPIKKGADFITTSGELISNNKLVTNKCKPRSYAYCSDTNYDERIIEFITGVDLLYHEATFMNDMLSRAKETFHSTAIQAATIAQKAQVHKLIIGHYSARYKDLQPLLEEAKTVFKNTILAIEGESIQIEQQMVKESCPS